MPRAVWTGSLSFGLVSIPVALYPATQPKDVRLHLFDRLGRRVRYRRCAEETEPESVVSDDAVEGRAAERTPTVDQVGATSSGAPGEHLVGMLATVWDPERYADEYRQELLRIISEKAPVDAAATAESAATPTSRVEELMEALKRSVEEAKTARESHEASPRRKSG